MASVHALADLEDRAYQKGYADYEDGACEYDNPYLRTSLLGRAWLDGWERACDEYAHESERDAYDAVLDDPRHTARQ